MEIEWGRMLMRRTFMDHGPRRKLQNFKGDRKGMKNYDPYFTKAKFDSVCPETGKQIRKGDEIAYYPRSREAFHISSKASEDLRGTKASQAFGMADANW